MANMFILYCMCISNGQYVHTILLATRIQRVCMCSFSINHLCKGDNQCIAYDVVCLREVTISFCSKTFGSETEYQLVCMSIGNKGF